MYHLYTDASFEQGRGGTGGILFERRGLLLRWFSEWRYDVRSMASSLSLSLLLSSWASVHCAPAFGMRM